MNSTVSAACNHSQSIDIKQFYLSFQPDGWCYMWLYEYSDMKCLWLTGLPSAHMFQINSEKKKKGKKNQCNLATKEQDFIV